VFAAFPLVITIDILRYRLYNIDVIIRRTLIYGVLTALLAAIYFGSVVLLQQIVSAFTAQTDPPPAVTVASTLLIAALFQPLRRRIHAIIDRRFYRRKYNVQQTLQTFSDKLRDETDLAHISDELVAVVQNTRQPAHVSLWLAERNT
jgi:hypothetical protein